MVPAPTAPAAVAEAAEEAVVAAEVQQPFREPTAEELQAEKKIHSRFKQLMSRVRALKADEAKGIKLAKDAERLAKKEAKRAARANRLQNLPSTEEVKSRLRAYGPDYAQLVTQVGTMRSWYAFLVAHPDC
jgi:hypothetical protein